MFKALCTRRNIRFKYDRYLHAGTQAAIYNVNRASSDSPVLSAWDFIREPDPEREQTQAIKATIRQTVGQMPSNVTRDKLLEVRARVIASLTAQGRTDAEELWCECWPTITPDKE